MSTERIKELLELMENHDLAELELSEGEFKVRLAKHQAVVAAAPAVAAPPVPAAQAESGGGAAKDTSDLVPVKSPIVGTFYKASSPDADPFVKVGDTINKDTVVCIVEAMKVMNEIKAETSGTVVEILVDNGEAVEFGQPLFLVKP